MSLVTVLNKSVNVYRPQKEYFNENEGKPKWGRLTNKPATSTTPWEGFLCLALEQPILRWSQRASHGSCTAQALPTANCCQPTASNTLPLSLLQNSSSKSKSPRLSLICHIIPYQASLAPPSLRSHQSYSKHITHPHHFLSCLAADLPQRCLKGALMFFVSPLCLGAIKIKSMPPSLSWLFPLQLFFCTSPHNRCELWALIYHQVHKAVASWEQ